jgi:hypothetical protein
MVPAGCEVDLRRAKSAMSDPAEYGVVLDVVGEGTLAPAAPRGSVSN